MLTFEMERVAERQRLRMEQRLRVLNLINPEQFSILPRPLIMTDPEFVKEIRQRILLRLAEVNLIIFIIAGGLGYLLAGKTLQPIKTMLEEQHRFISDASHELRTPLTSLKTSIEVALRDRQLTLVQARKLLAENIDEVNQLQQLSDNLLTLTQSQSFNQPTDFSPISLLLVTNAAIKKIAPLARSKKQLIKNHSYQIKINGVKDQLVELITILLDNAIKYSPPKTVIEIKTKKEGNKAVITIQDHGIGIDEKDLPHIFDRFYRADSARSKNNRDGFGLGLAIDKKIVENHYGTISVKSRINQGTTFIIKLPINQNAG